MSKLSKLSSTYDTQLHPRPFIPAPGKTTGPQQRHSQARKPAKDGKNPSGRRAEDTAVGVKEVARDSTRVPTVETGNSTPVDVTAPPTVPPLLEVPVDNHGAMHAALQHSFVSPPPSQYPLVPLPVAVIGDPWLMSSYPPFSAPRTRLHSETVGKLISFEDIPTGHLIPVYMFFGTSVALAEAKWVADLAAMGLKARMMGGKVDEETGETVTGGYWVETIQ
ncbi:unnamed protein product [Vitrella brassicaformis CCMP3155]|uniref:Uncharacterized protein n=1 Tax=Vitrella brassicaformis (strain CCMP3155) TaxID=1169540 RepID=A0A0G4F7J3_VITBC|nr:unnamed protein product [Vitrella brassicaformis CCMP3155]|eukprot:CEM08650.1 unnamed protein product [Vitrella brassicaformis CCMP3155]